MRNFCGTFQSVNEAMCCPIKPTFCRSFNGPISFRKYHKVFQTLGKVAKQVRNVIHPFSNEADVDVKPPLPSLGLLCRGKEGGWKKSHAKAISFGEAGGMERAPFSSS